MYAVEENCGVEWGNKAFDEARAALSSLEILWY